MTLADSSSSFVPPEPPGGLAALLIMLRPDGRVLPGTIDADPLIEAAERHGLLPLLARHLAESRNSNTDLYLHERVRALSQAHARAALGLTRELIRAVELLSSAGIEAIALKGPALSWQLYHDLAVRVSADVDLLIRPHDVRNAVEALERHGYRSERDLAGAAGRLYLAHQHDLEVRSPDGALIELHWQLLQRRFAVDLDLGGCWDRSEVVLLPHPIRVLSPSDTLLFLAVHGMKHRWNQLDLVADISALLFRYPIDLVDARRCAERLGVRRILDVALELSRRVDGDAALGACEPGLELVCESIARAWNEPERAGGGLTRLDLQLRERWRDRLRLLLRSAFLPTPQDWDFLPLPERLVGLYYLIHPLRLLAARR